MNCPYCNSDLPVGTTYCTHCGGAIPGDVSTHMAPPSSTASIPATFAWILAFLPQFLLGVLIMPVCVLLDNVSDEVIDKVIEILEVLAFFLYFAANVFILHKDEKLLAENHRRDEMLAFMRIGIFFCPVYLCARAVKIDKKWGYALVGLLNGIFWLWVLWRVVSD